MPTGCPGKERVREIWNEKQDGYFSRPEGKHEDVSVALFACVTVCWVAGVSGGYCNTFRLCGVLQCGLWFVSDF